MLARGRSETGGLDYELHLKKTARVVLNAKSTGGPDVVCDLHT